MSRFINPYNFIPFNSQRKSKEYKPSKELHTGVIEYTIKTQTPLIIPDTRNSKTFKKNDNDMSLEGFKEHKSYDFYSYPSSDCPDSESLKQGPLNPVLPGSELRGMIRSIYETLTGSCMGVLNEDTHPVKRTGEIFKPALIHRIRNNGSERFELIKAESYRINIGESEGENYQEGQELYFPEPIITDVYIKKSRSQGNRTYSYAKKGTVCYEDECSMGGENCYKIAVRGSSYKYLVKKDKVEKIKPLDNENTIYFNLPNPVIGRYCTSSSEDMVTGFLIKGGWGGTINKRRCHVFIQSGRILKEGFGQSDRDLLDRVLESYKKQAKKEDSEQSSKYYYEQYETNLNRFYNGEEGTSDYFPIYYSKVNVQGQQQPIWYFAPAAITKEAAHYTVGKRAQSWVPCNQKTDLCPACSLFGMVGPKAGNNVNARASKIRVADAYLDPETKQPDPLYEKITTLQTLSSPKLSNSEFYLNKIDNADFWTYDYYIKDGIVKFFDENATLLRGRKYYWHQPAMKIKCVQPSNINITVRPLQSKVTFVGKLYFDNITDKQLKQLIWILNGGEDNKYSYKLGGAKPLGYGSVKLSVRKVAERKFNYEDGNISYKENICYEENLKENKELFLSYEDEALGFDMDEQVKGAFEKISNFEVEWSHQVSYPITSEQCGTDTVLTEGFKWFTEQNHAKKYNRNGKIEIAQGRMRNKRTEEKLIKVLPNINDSDVSLDMRVSTQE